MQPSTLQIHRIIAKTLLGPTTSLRGPLEPVTMAEHLASIFGTEKDRVNCPFYIKIG
jgi:hypothetical protein